MLGYTATMTDSPVEDVSPLANFYASVTRKLIDGSRFYPEQSMTRIQALQIKAILLKKLTQAGLGDLDIKLEGVDSLHFLARQAKKRGILADFSPALHFEFPRAPRKTPKLTIEFLKLSLLDIVKIFN